MQYNHIYRAGGPMTPFVSNVGSVNSDGDLMKRYPIGKLSTNPLHVWFKERYKEIFNFLRDTVKYTVMLNTSKRHLIKSFTDELTDIFSDATKSIYLAAESCIYHFSNKDEEDSDRTIDDDLVYIKNKEIELIRYVFYFTEKFIFEKIIYFDPDEPSFRNTLDTYLIGTIRKNKQEIQTAKRKLEQEEHDLNRKRVYNNNKVP